MADVFISYSRNDGEFAQRLKRALAEAGSTVWMDEDISGGSEFSDVIEAELNAAGKVIVLWSADSIRSRWVRDEASAAAEQGKLVPILVDGSQPPMGFRQVQTLDLAPWARLPDAPLPDTLMRALGRQVSGSSAAVSPQPKRNVPLAAIIAAIALVMAGGVWFAFGREDGVLASAELERVPLVVRALSAVTPDKPADAGLAQGITDELIVRLRSVPELQIATAGADGEVPGGAFDKAYVVDGNIRTSGDQVRVTARLADPDGEILWSETFDRKMTELFEVQELVASSIAKALSVPLDVGASARQYGGTTNPEAHAAYLQAVAHWLDLDNSVPMGYLQRAVELDPQFVKAQAQIASAAGVALGVAPLANKADADALLKVMDERSSKAVKANPDLWVGHAARAWYFWAKRNFGGFVREMELVRKLDPGNSPEVRNNLANYLLEIGQAKNALAVLRTSEMIDPIYRKDPWLVFFNLMAGENEEAIRQYEQLKKDGQVNLQSYVFHAAAAYQLSGKREKGLAEVANYPGIQATLEAVGAAGELDRMTIPELRQWATDRFGYGGQFAIGGASTAAAMLGRNELALKLLRISTERPGANGIYMIWHPALAEVRKTEGFRQLVTDLGYVEQWRKTGNWGDFCRPQGSSFACS